MALGMSGELPQFITYFMILKILSRTNTSIYERKSIKDTSSESFLMKWVLESIFSSNWAFRSSLTNTKRKQAKQYRQIQKSTRAKSTTARPKIKPLIERINKDLEKGEETTLMSGHTNIVVLFITNIPDDLHQVNEVKN